MSKPLFRLVLCGAAAWVAAVFLLYPGPQQETSEPQSRRLSCGYTLENTSRRLLRDVVLLVPAPLEVSPGQECVDLEASRPFEQVRDELGNRFLRFTFPELPPFAARIVTVRAELESRSIPRPFPLRDPHPYLEPSRFVQSEHPDIARRAEALSAGGAEATAKRIFDWVRGQVSDSGFLREERGALFALRKGKGDCTEQADLFVALSRASGLAARRVSGWLAGSRGVLRPGNVHDWAQFHDGRAWRIADPQQGVFGQPDTGYVAALIRKSPVCNEIGGCLGSPAGSGAVRFRMND
jgi:transglutaminase-like putative cysteine protease